MKRIAGLIALALVFSFGSPAVFAADQSMQGDKKKTDKQQQKAPGAGRWEKWKREAADQVALRQRLPRKLQVLTGLRIRNQDKVQDSKF